MRRHVDSVRARFPAQANPVPLQDIPVQDTSVPDSLEEDTCVFSPSTNNEVVNSETSSSGRNSESTARAPAAAAAPEHTSSQHESTFVKTRIQLILQFEDLHALLYHQTDSHFNTVYTTYFQIRMRKCDNLAILIHD